MDRRSMIAAARIFRARGMRPPWPMREPAPPRDFSEVQYGDVCPPWSYGAPTVAPPPPAHRMPLPKDSPLLPDATAAEMGRAIADQAARQFQNPYTQPTPFSQDWDIVGENDVPAATPGRYRLARFTVPHGWVGVLKDINVNVPTALQPFTTIIPVINENVLKSFRSQVFAGAGTIAPVETTGLPSIPNIFPKELFHALQEEMIVGVDAIVAGANPAGLIRGAMRGRYWIPDDATRYWNYAKSD